MYVLETPRLGLRSWIDADLQTFTDMNADPSVMEYYPNTLTPIETKEMVERINAQFLIHGFGLWAVERKDTRAFIGYTGLSVPRFESTFTPCVEIGWRLAFDEWGKGFATEAARACLEYGFNHFRLREIVSFTSTLNLRSVSVMKKCGMRYAGSFEHPLIEEGHKLKTHLLYRSKNPAPGSPE